MSKFISTAGEIEMGIVPPTRPPVRIVGGYQPVAYDGRREMRVLIKEMKAIERGDRKVSRHHWIRLARRYVRAKWAIEGREMALRPPRGRSGAMRPTAMACGGIVHGGSYIVGDTPTDASALLLRARAAPRPQGAAAQTPHPLGPSGARGNAGGKGAGRT